jgi:hypothetical protein
MRWAICALAAALVQAIWVHAAEPAEGPEVKPILEKLGVTLKVTERPAWPKPPATTVEVALVPQVDEEGTQVVSFGLPFGPGWLGDDKQIRVTGADGQEVPVFTKPLVSWWIDRKQGSLRSVIVQFEASFKDKTPQKATVAWDKPRAKSRPAMTPIAETQVKRHVEPPGDYKTKADAYDFQCPKVLALLPPEWLCASLVVWQQVPAKENRVAPWFDKHLVEKFDYSTRNTSANQSAFEAHLFDRPATYVKVYARHGDAKYLLASIQAADFYIQHLDPRGFLNVKKGSDHKYTYTEGPALAYMLTGDERFREAIERGIKCWDTWRAIEYRGKGFWTERHAGFGMMAYLHAYEVSGDPKLLDKAKQYFDAVLSMQVKPVDGGEPDGAWVHRADDHGDGNGWTTSPWMSAFLTDAIWKYWMLTGDPRAPASLAMYAKFTEKHAVTPDGKSTYYMANSPGRGKSEDGGGPEHNVEGVYLLALGHYLSGGADEAYLKKIETLWPPVMQDGANNPGRKFTWRFRETSTLIWLLSHAKAGP